MATRSNQKKDNSNNLSSWVLPIALLFIFPPVAILLIVLKLFSASKKTTTGRHPYYSQRSSEPVGVRTTTVSAENDAAARRQQAVQAARAQSQLLADLEDKAKRMVTMGAITLGIFLCISLPQLFSAIDWLIGGYPRWFFEDLLRSLPLWCIAAGGGGVLWAGLRKRKQITRFRRYLAMIGQHAAVSLTTLSETTGRSMSKLCDDLDDMLNAGFFPLGFLDYGSKQLVISGTGVSEKPKPEPKPAEEKKAQTDENSILVEIRQINDDIDNEKLSAQIDRIGVITAKILAYQETAPDKAPQLHSFLSYYLPTTLKILRSYAKLEDQEVAGQNITSTMERIEHMMDKVVEGFEKQLDLLFQGDAMDITTDVEVLERMLAKDGLSDSDSMTLSL